MQEKKILNIQKCLKSNSNFWGNSFLQSRNWEGSLKISKRMFWKHFFTWEVEACKAIFRAAPVTSWRKKLCIFRAALQEVAYQDRKQNEKKWSNGKNKVLSEKALQKPVEGIGECPSLSPTRLENYTFPRIKLESKATIKPGLGLSKLSGAAGESWLTYKGAVNDTEKMLQDGRLFQSLAKACKGEVNC